MCYEDGVWLGLTPVLSCEGPCSHPKTGLLPIAAAAPPNNPLHAQQSKYPLLHRPLNLHVAHSLSALPNPSRACTAGRSSEDSCESKAACCSKGGGICEGAAAGGSMASNKTRLDLPQAMLSSPLPTFSVDSATEKPHRSFTAPVAPSISQPHYSRQTAATIADPSILHSPQPTKGSHLRWMHSLCHPTTSKQQVAWDEISPCNMFITLMALSGKPDLPRDVYCRMQALLEGWVGCTQAAMGEAGFKEHKTQCEATYGSCFPLKQDEVLCEWGILYAILSTRDGLMQGPSIQAVCQCCFTREEPTALDAYVLSRWSFALVKDEPLHVVTLALGDNCNVERTPILNWLTWEKTLGA